MEELGSGKRVQNSSVLVVGEKEPKASLGFNRSLALLASPHEGGGRKNVSFTTSWNKQLIGKGGCTSWYHLCSIDYR